jgi:hypothetical protein
MLHGDISLELLLRSCLATSIRDSFTDRSQQAQGLQPFLALKSSPLDPFTISSRYLALIGALFWERKSQLSSVHSPFTCENNTHKLKI